VKNIITTLVISVLLLGVASFLLPIKISLNKNLYNSLAPNNVLGTEQINLSNEELTKAFLNKDSLPVSSINSDFIPFRDWSVEEPEIKAKATGVFDIDEEKFIYQKNIKEKLPIASLTKIMAAIVAVENLELEDTVIISKKAVMTEGENGRLIIGEELKIIDLLNIMLIESSNDAAVALADAVGENFVSLMNEKTKEIGMSNSHFIDPTGIDKRNYSTISDLAKLIKYLTIKPLLWQILGTKEIIIYSQNKKIEHQSLNTNKLLGEIPEVVAGKTGWTEEAGGCMLTIIKIPQKPGKYLMTIILGSENRELETKHLIEWVNKAYLW